MFMIIGRKHNKPGTPSRLGKRQIKPVAIYNRVIITFPPPYDRVCSSTAFYFLTATTVLSNRSWYILLWFLRYSMYDIDMYIPLILCVKRIFISSLM